MKHRDEQSFWDGFACGVLFMVVVFVLAILLLA